MSFYCWVERDSFQIVRWRSPASNSRPSGDFLHHNQAVLTNCLRRLSISGYPAQDYINGIPRKTALCLSFSPEKFHNFMVAIYPKLEDRMYDMYRIDKTRRLIRIEVKSPRELKDMKYQGSVIIIPYVSSSTAVPIRQ